MGLPEIIGSIILSGIQLWSEERKLAFERKHHKALKELREAENAMPPLYTDAAVMLAEERYSDLLVAFAKEMGEEVKSKEKKNA